MTKDEKIGLVLSVIGNEWMTYQQINKKIKNKLSVGGISAIIWNNTKEFRKHIEWKAERYASDEWQTRMLFRKLTTIPELV